MLDGIIELVKLGFHGCAIAVLVLCAKLILKSFSLKRKERKDINKILIPFMVLSFMFFIVGVGAQIYDNKKMVKLNLVFSPDKVMKDTKLPPICVKVNSLTQKINPDSSRVYITHNSSLHFVLDDYIDEIDSLKGDIHKIISQYGLSEYENEGGI